ncbi:MAG: hypothetical protein ABF479_01270, partial [Gluconacetobacter sp.]
LDINTVPVSSWTGIIPRDERGRVQWHDNLIDGLAALWVRGVSGRRIASVFKTSLSSIWSVADGRNLPRRGLVNARKDDRIAEKDIDTLLDLPEIPELKANALPRSCREIGNRRFFTDAKHCQRTSREGKRLRQRRTTRSCDMSSAYGFQF